MAAKPTILMTGTSGFAGGNIAAWFLPRGYRIIAPGRTRPADDRLEFHQISRIDRYTFWESMLAGVDVVVHLAGRAHQMREKADSYHLYFETNFEGSVNLAYQAAKQGVKRFIFVSSIKAMISDACEQAMTENTPCNPLI